MLWFEAVAEQKIREAMARGEFADTRPAARLDRRLADSGGPAHGLPGAQKRGVPAPQLEAQKEIKHGAYGHNRLSLMKAREALPIRCFVAATQPISVIVSINAKTLNDLRAPPGNRLEALKGDRKGQHSIRINEQWRICFLWRTTDATDVEIVDYH